MHPARSLAGLMVICAATLAGCSGGEGVRSDKASSKFSSGAPAPTDQPMPDTSKPAPVTNSLRELAQSSPASLSERQWKELLTPEQYRIAREKGTERPYSGKYWNHFASGYYRCVACQTPLFASATQFDSHCGWPAFSAAVDGKAVMEHEDKSHGMVRTEVTCAHCMAHLGHVFNDGPPPSGIRYCINSESLEFIPAENAAEELKKAMDAAKAKRK